MIAALTVVLEHDLREDDLAPLMTAIRQLRGVLDVYGHVSSPDGLIALERAKREIRDEIRATLASFL